MAMANTRGRPSAASGVALIVRRELGTYFGTPSGWIIAALVLMAEGILFNTRAVGSSARYSSDVLSQFIYDASGVAMAAAILVSIRLIAEERKQGTLALLMNSSLTEGEIVLAKYLSALAFLAVLLGLSLYIPALVFVRGKVSIGHIATGYAGLFLLASAVVAIGTFASSIAKSQVVAGAVASAITAVMVLLWTLARIIDGPLGDLVGHMALHDRHFRPFMQGTLSLQHVLFYVSVSALFLVLARNGLEARRWTS